jgi:ketosteroid isomerase-like protein
LVGFGEEAERQMVSDAAWVEDLFDAWNTFDGPRAGSHYAPDAVIIDVGADNHVYEGRDAVVELWNRIGQTYPYASFSLKRVACTGDLWAAEWEHTGTNAQNRSWKFLGATFFDRRDGLIVSQRDYWNKGDYLRQVGGTL